METLEEYFSTRVSAFLDDTGLSPMALGRKALNDPNLVRQIEGGRSLTLRSADRVLAFISGFDRESGGRAIRPAAPNTGSPHRERRERG